jgi:hypothetical protein
MYFVVLWRSKRIVDHQQGAAIVGRGGDTSDIDDLQERVGRRLDPDQLRGMRNCRRESLRRGILGVARDEAPGLEHTLEQAECAAVEVGGRDHFVAGPQGRQHGRGRRQTRRESQGSLAPLQGRQARFEGRSCGVSAPGILITLVPARCFLSEGGGRVDRDHGRPGRRVCILAGVDGPR